MAVKDMTTDELVKRKDELIRELSAVRVEIASRAGESDKPVMETATDAQSENVETAAEE